MPNSLATHPWAYPVLEVVHLLGVALLLGNLVLLELRVWGLATALPVEALARLALRVVLCGFGLAAASGLMMLASQWNDMLANRVFWWKMGLLTAAGFNAALFHARSGLQRLDSVARFQTALSLGLWVLVVACGRFIAYA
jgi:hypothetical protein